MDDRVGNPTDAIAGPRGTAISGTSPSRRSEQWLRSASDDTLLSLVRQRHVGAFGELYRRHRREAYRYARLITYRHLWCDAADDVVAEAMRKVLTALVNGRGPHTGFRPYLFTTIRTVAFRESTKRRDEPPGGDQDHEFEPGADENIDTYVAVKALASLPERLKRVLWLTEAMKLPATEVAALLGTEPRGVAMLAMRSREALRVAYVRQHLPSSSRPACGRALELLSRRPVVEISPRQAGFLEHHLAACDRCRDAAAQIDNEISGWPRALTSALFTRHLDDETPIDEPA